MEEVWSVNVCLTVSFPIFSQRKVLTSLSNVIRSRVLYIFRWMFCSFDCTNKRLLEIAVV